MATTLPIPELASTNSHTTYTKSVIHVASPRTNTYIQYHTVLYSTWTMASSAPKSLGVIPFAASYRQPGTGQKDLSEYRMTCRDLRSAPRSGSGFRITSVMKPARDLTTFRITPARIDINTFYYGCLVRGKPRPEHVSEGKKGKRTWKDAEVTLLTSTKPNDWQVTAKTYSQATVRQISHGTGFSYFNKDADGKKIETTIGKIKVWSDESGIRQLLIYGEYVSDEVGYEAIYVPVPSYLANNREFEKDTQSHIDKNGNTRHTVLCLGGGFDDHEHAALIHLKHRAESNKDNFTILRNVDSRGTEAVTADVSSSG